MVLLYEGLILHNKELHEIIMITNIQKISEQYKIVGHSVTNPNKKVILCKDYKNLIKDNEDRSWDILYPESSCSDK